MEARHDADVSGLRVLIAAGLAVASFLLFVPVRGYPFLFYDDPLYVTRNPHVAAGLTWDSVRWALTSGDETNWFPLTRLTHLLDVTLFGLSPGPHHLVNVALHVANTALLFWIFSSLTMAVWRSAFVAAVFALHPLRVESVAWVSERKDVLSTFFVLVTLFAYAAWARRPGRLRAVAVAAFFACALMSKPMAVTLPVLLLLLDVWPLGRISVAAPDRRVLRRLVVEKLPLFLLSGASAVVTFGVQHLGGATEMLRNVPLSARLLNPLVAYAAYLVKIAWPARLAVIYPYPIGGPSVARLLAALALLAAVTALAIRERARRPYLLVGWLWYLVGLLPVIGWVQVGTQAMADRYTYLPVVGIALAVAWSAADLAGTSRLARAAVAALAVLASGAMAWSASVQLRVWRSEETLFAHAIAVTEGNYVAHHNYGVAIAKQGRYAEALEHEREAVRLSPDWEDRLEYRRTLGFYLEQVGRFDEAIETYRGILRENPAEPQTLNDLGIALGRIGDLDGAIRHYREAVKVLPRDPQIRMNLGIVLEMRGRIPEAIDELERSLALRPGDAATEDRVRRLRATLATSSGV